MPAQPHKPSFQPPPSTPPPAPVAVVPYDPSQLTGLVDVSDILPDTVLQQYHLLPLERPHAAAAVLGVTSNTDRLALPRLAASYPNLQLQFGELTAEQTARLLNLATLRQFDQALAGDYSQFSQRLATTAPKTAFGLVAQLAYLMNASDIHIEPQADAAHIRFRLDGVLHPITTVKTEAYKIFLADLQTRAGIKWGSDTPQSGRISHQLIGPDVSLHSVNMRIETIPAFHGEEIVVRLFNRDPGLLKLDNMGFSAEQIAGINQYVGHFSGLILVVGPTGSGKTSTLYALINQLNNPEVKIITLEDPVEYDLPGISQVPVRTEDAESFAAKLRAVLREDPNVIMIGEIRDPDTARTALQAALTGHLVLSTFHAAGAAAAVSRLEDMLGDSPLLGSATKTIIAQRLVRRVCQHCAEGYQPTDEELKFINQQLQSLPEPKRPQLTNLQLRRGSGCPQCHGIGYLGRIAIAEQLVITPGIQKLMGLGLKTVGQDVQAEAVKDGMITLLQDGLLKAIAGFTTLEEIRTNIEA